MEQESGLGNGGKTSISRNITYQCQHKMRIGFTALYSTVRYSTVPLSYLQLVRYDRQSSVAAL